MVRPSSLRRRKLAEGFPRAFLGSSSASARACRSAAPALPPGDAGRASARRVGLRGNRSSSRTTGCNIHSGGHTPNHCHSPTRAGCDRSEQEGGAAAWSSPRRPPSRPDPNPRRHRAARTTRREIPPSGTRACRDGDPRGKRPHPSSNCPSPPPASALRPARGPQLPARKCRGARTKGPFLSDSLASAVRRAPVAARPACCHSSGSERSRRGPPGSVSRRRLRACESALRRVS